MMITDRTPLKPLSATPLLATKAPIQQAGPSDGAVISSAALQAPPAEAPAPTDKPVGPVADYALQSSIVAHQLARDLCPALVSVAMGDIGNDFKLSGAGYDGPNSGYDNSMVWSRDYNPTYVRQPDGDLKVVRYLSDNQKRSQYDASDYIPVQPPKPGQEFFRTPEGGRWLDVETMPIKHEDGNLVSTGEFAFMTDHIFDENSKPTYDQNLKDAGYKPRQPDEVLDVLSKSIDLPRNKMVVMPKMPGEATGHVDMYVMALGPKEVLLPQIEDKALGAISYPQEVGVGKQVQSFLNEQADRLTGMGFKVDRLPMMPPNYLHQDSSDPSGWKGHFYSPTNSLLVNTEASPGQGAKKEAILPTFDAKGYPDSYKQLNQSYQNQWKDFFQQQGYDAKLVDATALGQANGLFRCVTHPVPA